MLVCRLDIEPSQQAAGLLSAKACDEMLLFSDTSRQVLGSRRQPNGADLGAVAGV